MPTSNEFFFPAAPLPLAAALCAALALASCGGSEEPAPPAGAGPPGPGGARASSVAGAGDALSDGERPELLFSSREEPLPEWGVDNLRRLDPAYDGWRTEVLHDHAKHELHDVLEAWVKGEGDPRAHLSAGFEGTSVLRPAELETLFDDGQTRVRRPARIDAGLTGPGGLERSLGGLRAPLEGAADVRPALKIVGVELQGEDRFVTDVLVHVSAAAGGGVLQQNMEWRIAWDVAPGDALAVRSVELVSYEEVETARPMFGEITRAVLGGNDFFAGEVLRGINEHYFRVDRLAGNAFLGVQGVAVGDFDSDGLDDIYLCQQGGLPNRLLRRQADGTAVDVAHASRVAFLENTRSALFLDIDNDGDQDLVVARGADIVVCYNDGTGVFGETLRLEGGGEADIYSQCAADADLDGDLDLYACRYVVGGLLHGVPTPYHDADNGASNIYWRNDGERRFINATAEVGLDQNNTKFSLAAIWEDFDGDGDPDLYVTNDFGRNNLYRNDGGRFTDVAGEAGAEDMAASMGASCADFDLDGDVDLLVSNMFSSAGLRIARQQGFMGGEHPELRGRYLHHARGNTLLRNRGDGTFEDATLEAGVALGRWAWGARFADFDNDGLEDIYVPNGFVTNSDPEDV